MNHEAVYNTHSNVVSINGESKCFDKDGNEVVIDETKVANEDARLQVIHDSTQYQRDRKPLYGTWEEQLDMMYHGTWEKHVSKVKKDIPKGNS